MTKTTSKCEDIPRSMCYKADAQKEMGSFGILGRLKNDWWPIRSYSWLPRCPERDSRVVELDRANRIVHDRVFPLVFPDEAVFFHCQYGTLAEDFHLADESSKSISWSFWQVGTTLRMCGFLHDVDAGSTPKIDVDLGESAGVHRPLHAFVNRICWSSVDLRRRYTQCLLPLAQRTI